MKPNASRLLLAIVAVMVAWLALVGASSSKTVLQPDKLIILSTTDVKGKTSPCG